MIIVQLILLISCTHAQRCGGSDLQRLKTSETRTTRRRLSRRKPPWEQYIPSAINSGLTSDNLRVARNSRRLAEDDNSITRQFLTARKQQLLKRRRLPAKGGKAKPPAKKGWIQEFKNEKEKCDKGIEKFMEDKGLDEYLCRNTSKDKTPKKKTTTYKKFGDVWGQSKASKGLIFTTGATAVGLVLSMIIPFFLEDSAKDVISNFGVAVAWLAPILLVLMILTKGHMQQGGIDIFHGASAGVLLLSGGGLAGIATHMRVEKMDFFDTPELAFACVLMFSFTFIFFIMKMANVGGAKYNTVLTIYAGIQISMIAGSATWIHHAQSLNDNGVSLNAAGIAMGYTFALMAAVIVFVAVASCTKNRFGGDSTFGARAAFVVPAVILGFSFTGSMVHGISDLARLTDPDPTVLSCGLLFSAGLAVFLLFQYKKLNGTSSLTQRNAMIVVEVNIFVGILASIGMFKGDTDVGALPGLEYGIPMAFGFASLLLLAGRCWLKFEFGATTGDKGLKIGSAAAIVLLGCTMFCGTGCAIGQSSSLDGWAIASIVFAGVLGLAIIVLGTMALIKKCSTGKCGFT